MSVALVLFLLWIVCGAGASVLGSYTWPFSNDRKGWVILSNLPLGLLFGPVALVIEFTFWCSDKARR